MSKAKIGRFTLEEISEMSREEYIKHRPEIIKAVNEEEVTKTEKYSGYALVFFILGSIVVFLFYLLILFAQT